MNPAVVERNFTPSSVGTASGSAAVTGDIEASQIVHGHVCGTIETTMVFGVPPSPTSSKLPLSSNPRDLRVTLPGAFGVHA